MIHYIEDDANIRELVVYTLKHSGYEARGFEDAPAFWAACREQKPELILLDIMLPKEDGLSVLKKLKEDPTLFDVPVIMVTAKGGEYDKVLGLDSGADDYIAKPFGMMELVSRIKALLRRTQSRHRSTEHAISFGRLMLDATRYSVFVDGKEVVLTHKEFELLRILMMNVGVAFSRDQLLRNVWGYEYSGGTRTVDVHVQTLRQKLGSAGSYIITVRGVGYRFEAAV